MRGFALISGLMAAVLTGPAAAQNARFMGVVTRDSLGHPVASAQVALPGLGRGTVTNSRGEFQLSDIPPGRYEVEIRAIGFEKFNATIEFAPGQTIDGDLTVTPVPVALDTVHATAANLVRGHAIELKDFEDRKRAHASGATFYDDSVLRKHDNEQLITVLGHMAGARVIIGTGFGDRVLPIAVDGPRAILADGKQQLWRVAAVVA